jgi:6-phosphofructokinase 2
LAGRDFCGTLFPTGRSAALLPVVTLTLNPALDLAVETAKVVPGPKLRCSAPAVHPGGGGINVSRVIRRLGGRTLALAALGGVTGDRLAALLAQEGVTLAPLPCRGETRESLTVTDAGTGQQFRFVLPGPAWRRRDADSALSAAVAAVGPGQFLVLSGSLPPGVPADFALRLARRIARKGAWLAIDTSGAALAAAIAGQARMALLRLDAAEAEAQAGRPLTTARDSADYALSLVRAGAADRVVLARGAEGSVMAGPEGRFLVRAPAVPVQSRIGAGDSFMAAMVLALARGRPPVRALQEGMAAASATVMTPATDLCRAADARRLIGACPVEPV